MASEETKKAISKYLAAPVGTSDAFFRDVVAGAYAAWVNDGVCPSVDKVVTWSGRSKPVVSKVMATEEYKTALRQRGVPVEDVHGLSAEQAYLISILTNPTDRRSLQGKLKAAGVPYNRYRAWLKDPFFSTYFNNLAEGVLQENQGNVLVKLTERAANQGDMKAIQLFLEVTGRHDPRRQQVMDVQSTIMRVVEIITKHVKDPATLTAIAGEIQILMGVGAGNPPPPVVQGSVVPELPEHQPTALIEQDQGPVGDEDASDDAVLEGSPVTPKTVYFGANDEIFDFDLSEDN